MVVFYGCPVACLVNGGSLLEDVATTFPSGGTASLLFLCFVTVLLTWDAALTGPSECSVKGGVSHPPYAGKMGSSSYWRLWCTAARSSSEEFKSIIKLFVTLCSTYYLIIKIFSNT